MTHLKINYLKTWNDEGTCYKQTIYISKDIKEKFNKKVIEKLQNEPKNFNYWLYLKKLNDNKVQYLKNTQTIILLELLKELNYNTKRFLLDRNTRIVIKR